MFIDIGASDKEDAEIRVKLGDVATIKQEFTPLGKLYKGKALITG